MKYYSQCKQDKFLNEVIFKGKNHGFFVDIGAYDGKNLSNTLFFEEQLNWKGICIEPNPNAFKELKKNRKCLCFNNCASSENGVLEFRLVVGGSAMLSGVVSTHDGFKNRIKRENKVNGGSEQIINIQSVRLDKLFNENQVKHIDFCSIDVEGHELKVLESIDFNVVNIDVFVIENSVGGFKLKRFLEPKGYKHVYTLDKCDMVFVRKNSGYLQKFSWSDRIKWKKQS